jgi:hypothetical protein
VSKSGLAADIEGGGKTAQTKVIAYTPHDGPNQSWRCTLLSGLKCVSSGIQSGEYLFLTKHIHCEQLPMDQPDSQSIDGRLQGGIANY